MPPSSTQKRSVFIILLLLAFAVMGILALAVFLLHLLVSSPTASGYIPKFKESPLELVMGDGFKQAHLYYKTPEKISVGEKLDSLQFITVHQKGNEFEISYLDNVVDQTGEGYVSFLFDYQNFDCFAVYQDQQLVKYQRIEFTRLPSPSDAWICKGFDFKNALKNPLQK